MSNNGRLDELKKEYKDVSMSPEQVEKMKRRMQTAKEENKMQKITYSKKHKVTYIYKWVAATTAAVVATFIILPNTSVTIANAMSDIPVIGKLVDAVTFRDYEYDSERQKADIEVPEIVVNNEMQEDVQESATTDTDKDTTVKESADEINKEIQQIADKLEEEFKANAGDQEGYQDISTSYEIIETTDKYFTVKLMCIQASGSGSEEDHYYTIDLSTGERLLLADLFQDGTDYITAISDDIKAQMRDQMTKDEKVEYWIDYEDVPEWNFNEITDETSFYIDENNDLVISFNEGDVAPMFMGCVQFVIDNNAIAGLRK